jgi:hypothetical protein
MTAHADTGAVVYVPIGEQRRIYWQYGADEQVTPTRPSPASTPSREARLTVLRPSPPVTDPSSRPRPTSPWLSTRARWVDHTRRLSRADPAVLLGLCCHLRQGQAVSAYPFTTGSKCLERVEARMAIGDRRRTQQLGLACIEDDMSCRPCRCPGPRSVPKIDCLS